MIAPWSPSRAREAARAALARRLRLPRRRQEQAALQIGALRLVLADDDGFDTAEAFAALAENLDAPDLLGRRRWPRGRGRWTR